MKTTRTKRNALAAGALLAAAGWIYYENYHIETEYLTISSSRIPEDFDGFRILQLSDFHCKSFGKDNRPLYRRIDQAQPDLIVMTGDMVSRVDAPVEQFLRLCGYVGRRYPSYYTVGNHELDLPPRQLQEMLAEVRGAGVTVLNNERAVISRGGSSIDLYGMSYDLKFYKDEGGSYRRPQPFTDEEQRKLIGVCDRRRYSVLLAHNPLHFPVYARWGADLTFSGHIHGGVVRLGKFGGLLSPGRRFFPQYQAGLYHMGEQTMLVSRGIGGPRLLNHPHLLTAVLQSKQS